MANLKYPIAVVHEEACVTVQPAAVVHEEARPMMSLPVTIAHEEARLMVSLPTAVVHEEACVTVQPAAVVHEEARPMMSLPVTIAHEQVFTVRPLQVENSPNPHLVVTLQPSNSTELYSCFISYSGKDVKFAERLYKDLVFKGVRCWFAPEDLKIGDKTRIRIDESIRVHEKLLLILSRHSVISDWVEQEVETALERERKEKRIVLFPIRLDDAVMNVESGWPALVRNTRNIGDFRKWKRHDSYSEAFDRLLRDLKAEEKQA